MSTQKSEKPSAMAVQMLSNLPKSTGELPFYVEGQEEILLEFIDLWIANSRLNRMDPQKNRNTMRMVELEQEFTEISTEVVKDEFLCPQVFNLLREGVVVDEKALKLEAIRKIYPKATTADLETIKDPKELSQKADACSKLREDVDRVNTQLRSFTHTRSQLTNPPVIQVTIEPRPDLDLEKLKFHITVDRLTVGYSVHNLLSIIYSYSNNQKNTSSYDGALDFTLGRNELDKLDKYLSDLWIWYNDFEMLMGAFIGQDPDKYVRTGHKPLSEIMRTEQANAKSGKDLFIDPKVTAQMLQMPQTEPVFLIGQSAIDFTVHPQRDALREAFLRMYKNANLTDTKGGPKIFTLKEGSETEQTYVSLLNIMQIEKIFDDFMAQASLTCKAREMGFENGQSKEFLQVFGEKATPEQVYHFLLQEKLAGLPIGPVNAEQTGVDVSGGLLSALRRMAERIFPKKEGESVQQLQMRYDEQVKVMLNDLTGIIIKPIENSAARTPNEAQLKMLLAPHRSAVQAYPMTADDMFVLCDKLKSCDAFAVANQRFEARRRELKSQGGISLLSMSEYVDLIRDEFMRRFRKSDGLLVPSLAFMSFASKIIYQPVTCVTEESVYKGFLSLSEILQGGDLFNGCGDGLGGRMVELATALENHVDDPVIAADMQFRKETADKLYRKNVQVGGESSGASKYKPFVYKQLGLECPEGGLTMPSHHEEKFYEDFKKEYTPAALYGYCAQVFLENFKLYARQNDKVGMFKMLQALSLTSSRTGEISNQEQADLQKRFSVNPDAPTKWSLSKFQLALPEALTTTLILLGRISNYHARNLILLPVEGSSLASTTLTRKPVVRALPSNNAGNSNAFFAPPNTNNNPANRFNVFQQPTNRAAAVRVRDVARSDIVDNPGHTSTG